MSEKLTLTKLELLRMARELVINEYIDRRAQDHNAWLAQADVVWRTQGVRLAYPSFPHYPTEVDILTRAQTLNSFLSQEDQAAEKVAIESTPVAKAPVVNVAPVQTLTNTTNHNEVVEVQAEDIKEIAPPEHTNYISNPAVYADILAKQSQNIEQSKTSETNAQPMSALAKLKNSLGLK